MQIEILINSNSYQTWSLFLRPLFRFVTQSREAKKRPRRRSHASLTSVLQYSDVFFVRFFSMCMYFVGCRLMKNKLLTERVWNLFPYVFPTFGAQAITNEDGSNSGTKQKASHARSLSFFAHLFAFVCKKIQDSDNQKFKVLRTETLSHVISNSKSAQ